jgi:hypothetical protein
MRWFRNSKNTDVIAFLRRIWPLLTVVVVIGALYDSWIFYDRWQSNRAAESARADAEAEKARKAIASIGGGDFGIRNFYASPAAIHAGEPVNICYSVFGAATLHLDPPVADVYPALSHCVQASPRQDTEFKLTATDSAGHIATSKFLLKVAR